MRAPIFVVGTGRSGSTVFFEGFARHPQVAWLTKLASKRPERLWTSRLLMEARSYAILDSLLGKHYGPSEAYPFWDHVFPGFSNPYRDLLAEDVTPISATRARALLGRIVTRSRNRFLAKITGWPRVRFLHEVFPQAFFIEVTRDPRATASSLLEVPFWDGWRGPPSWRRGPLPDDLATIWRQERESFVALAAIECVIVQRAVDECRSTLPSGQFHRVSYSDLCTETVEVFRKATAFCSLDWSARFEKSIRRKRFVDQSDKWRKNLSVAQQAVLQRVLEQAHEASARRVDEE
jgi:hypothetical protein